VDSGLSEFGSIDILVTNAGGPPAGRFEFLSTADWESAVRLTLFSVVDLVRGVLPSMKENKWGRILNITSIAVKQPVDNLMLSNSLRSAVTDLPEHLLMRSHQMELQSTISCPVTHGQNELRSWQE
jgi:3-oxoacyl-[acyl-carrier protein] reductase